MRGLIKFGVVLTFLVVFAMNMFANDREGTTYNLGYPHPSSMPEMIYVYDEPTPTVQVNYSAPLSEEERCLAENIYHEARGEPLRGRQAVAWVTMNRVNSADFPSTVCGVVNQISHSSDRSRRWAEFSWTLENPAEPRGTEWTDAQRIAREVYAQDRAGVENLWRNDDVMYYHADYVSEAGTRWFREALVHVNQIGDHIFYAAA
jgi:spore germination cell wall hydrolase CwlJ-like protein